jgi:hypothetical protein
MVLLLEQFWVVDTPGEPVATVEQGVTRNDGADRQIYRIGATMYRDPA